MKHIVTASGFEADLDEACFDDMDLLDDIVQLQSGNALALSSVADKVLGEHKKELYELFRNDQGRVPTRPVTAEVFEIINQLNGKKS